jgi:hypothetical protein
MDYTNLSRTDFDTVVTGELTHRILQLEESVNGIIGDFFITEPSRREQFDQLILFREGLTFQDKIGIVKAIVPFFQIEADKLNLTSLLKKVEDLKSYRNAMAHGRDVGGGDSPPTLKIGIISRSGKKKEIEITSASHQKMMAEAKAVGKELVKARAHLNEVFKSTSKKV